MAPPNVPFLMSDRHRQKATGCSGHETHTFGIDGMDEAAPILRTLYHHITRPDRVYRHRWRVGDVLMWDNCSTQHKAVGDYKLPQRRRLIRTSVQGTDVI